MKKTFSALLSLVALSLLGCVAARAQTVPDDPPRREVGVHFSALTLTPSVGYRTEIGFGGRITFNLNRNVALEAETTFFPNSGRSVESRASGRAFQGLFGVKAGRRWEKFGVFAKARPGFISFSRGREVLDTTSGSFFVFDQERATHFAADVGGVLELYVTRRWITRFDVGDTIIRYGKQTVATGAPPPFQQTFTIPDNTRHNLQVNAGIGYRF
jgi:hypothetical protein